MKKFINFTKELLVEMHLSVLREIGREIGVRAPASLDKELLIDQILKIQAGEIEPSPVNNLGAPPKFRPDISGYYVKDYESYSSGEDTNRYIEFHDSLDKKDTVILEGVLDITSSGYGFVRVNNYDNSKGDAFVGANIIKQFNLFHGDTVRVVARITEDDKKTDYAVVSVDKINGLSPSCFIDRINFDDLVPYYPTERVKLEGEGASNVAVRTVDLFSPLGFGQRGLIVAPPKTGKTTLLKNIARAIEKNNDNVKLIVLLIDERPEEVTDMRRSLNSEVVYSTFDESNAHHVRVAELTIGRAKRMVELGENVIVLMDSITRLARAYNAITESSGRTLSGGLDPNAIQPVKRIFGSARNIENGGSLTILSTALIETGSRLDDVIYEEFKGTGNMEITLSRNLSERRVFPAIDMYKTGTRKEELLLTKEELDASRKLRSALLRSSDGTGLLLEMIEKTKSNEDLVKKTDTLIKTFNL